MIGFPLAYRIIDFKKVQCRFIDPFAVDPDAERQFDGHKIVYIDAVSSREGFEIMRDFSDRCGERQRTRLMHALSKRHPFRVFKNVVSDLGLLDEWYAFKNSAYREIAQSRLEDCEIVKEGLVVRLLLEDVCENLDCVLRQIDLL